MPKITPFLWYDTQAEEAMNLYTSIFNNSKAGRITRSPAAPPGSNGVMSVTFEIEGQHCLTFNILVCLARGLKTPTACRIHRES